MTYFFRTAALTVAITLGAVASYAATDVENIEVSVDLEALGNAKAAAVWKDIPADLETALAERLVSQLSDEGAEIIIDIDEVSLANNFEQAMDIADAKLVGDVEIKMPGIANNERYTLTVRADQVRAYFPTGTEMSTVSVDSDVFYTAMVESFADNVAGKLE